jgi:imidazole glycerol-phosphate synthase subunit HisH
VIGVIDYRAGNAPSVGYALERLGIEHRLVSAPAGLTGCDRVILPGVGAARATLDSLTESGLVEPLTTRVLDDGLPFLGICIGLQVLFEHSAEGDTDCLGWIAGTVRRFDGAHRVPQIGWNAVALRRSHPVTERFPDGGHCYFVNSYYASPAEPSDVLGETSYGVDFCSIVASRNIVATQFHAEKSGELGLGILASFATWDPQC